MQVLPGRRFPHVINDNNALIADSFVLPEPALADVAAALRDPAGSAAPDSPPFQK